MNLKDAKLKIRVNEKQSRIIQEICIQNEVYWCTGDKEVSNTSSPYIFIASGYYFKRDFGDHLDEGKNYSGKTKFKDILEITFSKFLERYRPFKIGDWVESFQGEFPGRKGKIIYMRKDRVGFRASDQRSVNFVTEPENLRLICPKTKKLLEVHHIMPKRPSTWGLISQTIKKEKKKGLYMSLLQSLDRLSKKLKMAMSPSSKAQFKLGYLDEGLAYTKEGNVEFLSWLYDLHEDKYGEYCEAKVKEIEKKEKKDKK